MSARARMLFMVALAFASTSSGADLTLAEAARRALAADALLRAESHALSAAEAQARFDALAPPLVLGGELENVAGTGEVRGIHAAEATVRVSHVFERGGKREARRALGDAIVERQSQRLEARRLEVLAEVAHRYVEVLAANALLDVAAREVESAEALREAVAYRVGRGVAAESDLELAGIAIARAKLAREHAAHELDAARVTLAAAFGLDAPDFEDAIGALTPLPEMPEFDALAGRLPRTPAQRAFDHEAAELEARRRLAESTRAFDVTFSVGVRRLETFDDQGLVASVSVPLGTRDRGEHAVARAAAERDALDARSEAARIEARRSLFAKYQELKHARTELAAIDEAMLPAAQTALRLTRAGYDDARYSYLQLAQARATLVQLERERVEAAARYHRLLAEIERATAQSDEIRP